MALLFFVVGLSLVTAGGHLMFRSSTFDRSMSGFFLTYSGVIVVLAAIIIAVFAGVP